jgi:hypothetical protein
MGFITDLELQMDIEKEAFDKLPKEEQERIIQDKKIETAKRKEKILAMQKRRKQRD